MGSSSTAYAHHERSYVVYNISEPCVGSRCDWREGADPPGLEDDIMPDHDGTHEHEYSPNHRAPARVTHEPRQHR